VVHRSFRGHGQPVRSDGGHVYRSVAEADDQIVRRDHVLADSRSLRDPRPGEAVLDLEVAAPVHVGDASTGRLDVGRVGRECGPAVTEPLLAVERVTDSGKKDVIQVLEVNGITWPVRAGRRNGCPVERATRENVDWSSKLNQMLCVKTARISPTATSNHKGQSHMSLCRHHAISFRLCLRISIDCRVCILANQLFRFRLYGCRPVGCVARITASSRQRSDCYLATSQMTRFSNRYTPVAGLGLTAVSACEFCYYML
jgi:hypothetical protein